MNKDQQSKLRQAILEKLVEKEAEEKKAVAPLTEQKKPEAPLTGTEKYAQTLREQVSKDNRNRQKVIPEKTDLLAGDESVTAAQLRQSNQELWNRVQSSMASLGGGGGDTSKSLNKYGDSMHGKLIIGPYEEDSDRSFIEFDVNNVDSNLSLEAKERGQYVNMSNWLTHDDNDDYPSYPNEREYSGVAYGQGKFVASTWMSWWLDAGGPNDKSYISNAVAVSEDGENWQVKTFDDDPADSYGTPGHSRFFDASGIMYESNNDIWILYGGYGGVNDQTSLWWSEDADSWNPVVTPQDGSVQPSNKAYYSGVAYSPLLGKFLAAPSWNRTTKKMLASSTDGRTWTYDSAGEEFDSAVRGASYGVAWGNNKFVMSYRSRYDANSGNYISTGGIAWSHDGDSWNMPSVNYHLSDSYPGRSQWHGIVYAEDLGLFVSVADENFENDRDPFLWSTDGINWNFGTVHFKDRFSDRALLEGTVFYADGKFIAPLGDIRGPGNLLTPALWWSVDGKNWYPSEVRRKDDLIARRWRGLAYGENKWVACSPSTASVPKFASLEHNSKKNSLFVDDAIVATQDNLTPLFQKVNQLASRQNVIYSDSNPFDRDSYAANYISNGQMWFDATTDSGQLYVRHNQAWASVGGSGSGYPPLGDLYSTADHDSDTLVLVDSAYVQARADVDTSLFLPKSGGTISGQLKMASGQILLSSTGRNINVEFGTAGRLQYSGGTRFQWGNSYSTVHGTLNVQDGVDYNGDAVTGVLDMHDKVIKNVPTPTAGHHAVNKSYADAVGVIYQDAAPTGISDGQMWFNSSTDDGQMYIRHRDSWVAI